jgi:uncharacterized SAM-binding protein YcdF (DUF218 family)
MNKKIFKILDISIGVLFVFWLSGLVIFWVIADSVPAPATNTKTDAVIVFTGGPDRVNIGFDLLAENNARSLFISGVGENVKLEELFALWPSYDKDNPLCCITLGYEAKDTAGNGIETANWIEQGHIKSIRLVTAHYHMPRARIALLQANPDIHIVYHPVRSLKERGNILRSLRIWAGEYNKTIISMIKRYL